MTATNLKKIQRVYTTRTLNMKKIKIIGYDMDHTLAIYNRDNFEKLAFEETIKKFVQNGYPEDFFSFKYDPNYIQRGLLVDMDRGNLLKVDAHKYVKVAYHGHKRLNKQERDSTYNNRSFKAQDFLSVDTFFAQSEVQLFLEIVNYFDQNPKAMTKNYREIYRDLREFIDLAHKDGSIKNKVLKKIEHYIVPDKFLATALIRQIDGGKKLFLLTNSAWEYTNAVMTYILESSDEFFNDWQSFFEYIIVSANKPDFFTGKNPFFEVHPRNNTLMEASELKKNHIYQGGNAELFEKYTGYSGDSVLYVGDHIFGDIKSSKNIHNWRTALVVEELEHEIDKVESQKGLKETIYLKIIEKEQLDENLQRIKSNLAAYKRRLILQNKTEIDSKKMARLLQDISKLEEKEASAQAELDQKNNEIKDLVKQRERAIHPIWGELMRAGLERSRFADQLRNYACIYTSRVSNLRFYSQNKLFMPVSDTLPHE